MSEIERDEWESELGFVSYRKMISDVFDEMDKNYQYSPHVPMEH